MGFPSRAAVSLARFVGTGKRASRPTRYVGLTWQHRTYRPGNIARLLCNTRQRRWDTGGKGGKGCRVGISGGDGWARRRTAGGRRGQKRGVLYTIGTRVYNYGCMYTYMAYICVRVHATDSPPLRAVAASRCNPLSIALVT